MSHRLHFTVLLPTMVVMFMLPARAQHEPLAQDQVQGMVRDGLGDQTGAKAIGQRGLDFAPTEDFLQRLKAAGANEAFLQALRAARRVQPTGGGPKKPLNQLQVFALLAGQVASHRVAMLVRERGIDFDPTDDYLQRVRLAGGEDELINALKSAKLTKPPGAESTFEARQAQIRRYVAQGAELAKKGLYAEAELEYRAASQLDSQNADVYVSLAYVLLQQRKWGDAASAAREALRLNPNNDQAHSELSDALKSEGDWGGVIAEEREALRLNPKNDHAHVNIGNALGMEGDWDGMIAEEREALRLNPKNDHAHNDLGLALGEKGDLDGEIAEEREALRLNPNNDYAHSELSDALEKKGDWDGVIAEERERLRLNPKNYWAHFALGRALENKGDRAGARNEYCAAFALDPTDGVTKLLCHPL